MKLWFEPCTGSLLSGRQKICQGKWMREIHVSQLVLDFFTQFMYSPFPETIIHLIAPRN